MQKVLQREDRQRIFLVSIAISLILHLMAVVYLNYFLDLKKAFGIPKVKIVKQAIFTKPQPSHVLPIVFDRQESEKFVQKNQAPKIEKIQEKANALVSLPEDALELRLEKIPASSFSFPKIEQKIDVKNFLVTDSCPKNEYRYQSKSQKNFIIEELKVKAGWDPHHSKKPMLAAGLEKEKKAKKQEHNQNDKGHNLAGSLTKYDADKNRIQTAKNALYDAEFKSTFVKPVLLSSVSSLPAKRENILFLNEKLQKSRLQLILKNIQQDITVTDFAQNTADYLAAYQAYVPSLKELNTFSFGYNFDFDLEILPKREEDGYIFALTLIPKENLALESFRQNFYFIIDRSNSIQNRRFASTRYAVAAALNYLPKQDRFNLFLFDSTIESLFSHVQKPEKELKAKAKNFLIGKKLGSFFAAPSYALPLNAIAARPVQNKEIDNIIFITNGEGLKRAENIRVFKDFTKYNQGKRPLYILALQNDESLDQMELYANLNKGKLITAFTAGGLKKQLINLIKSLNEPKVQYLAIHPENLKNPEKISFFPFEAGSYFYQNQPFVLLGTAKELTVFDLFLQGRGSTGWFNLRKEIDLNSAQEGGSELERLWNLRRATALYESYLKDNDVRKLKLSKQILNKKL